MTTTYSATVPLRELLAMNLLASVDETRAEMNGVRVEAAPSQILLVATDGRRLAVLRSDGITEGTFQVTIPRATLRYVSRVLVPDASCHLSVGDGALTLKCVTSGRGPELSLHSKLIEATFPNWRVCWPTDEARPCSQIVLNREYMEGWKAIAEALDARDDGMLLLLRDETGPVEIVFPSCPNFRALQMPMRGAYSWSARPAWLPAKPDVTNP